MSSGIRAPSGSPKGDCEGIHRRDALLDIGAAPKPELGRKVREQQCRAADARNQAACGPLGLGAIRPWKTLWKSDGVSDRHAVRHAILEQKIDLEATLGTAQAVRDASRQERPVAVRRASMITAEFDGGNDLLSCLRPAPNRNGQGEREQTAAANPPRSDLEAHTGRGCDSRGLADAAGGRGPSRGNPR